MLLERFNPDTQEMETFEVCVSNQIKLKKETDYDEPQEPRYTFGWEEKSD